MLYLEGELGAGKTTLARGFLRALGERGAIRSPTYTLLETYETGRATVVHLDLYRLKSASELEPLGLRDLYLPRYVWLIEWPDRGGRQLPSPDVVVRLELTSRGRRLEAMARSAAGELWLASTAA